MNINGYLKFVVAVMGAVGSALETVYPSDRWAQVITVSAAAVLVYLVPNTPKGTP